MSVLMQLQTSGHIRIFVLDLMISNYLYTMQLQERVSKVFSYFLKLK